MKEFITPTYKFSPGLPTIGYVDLTGIGNFDIARLVAIINQTKGILIYSTASENTKYTSLVGTKVYLSIDTSTHSTDDVLQIIYNNESSTIDMIIMLNNLLSIIANPGIRDKTINADRVTLVGGSTTISSGTVTTVSNITSNGGYPAQMPVRNNNITAWYLSCRSRIS
jgi:hypothetical protein